MAHKACATRYPFLFKDLITQYTADQVYRNVLFFRLSSWWLSNLLLNEFKNKNYHTDTGWIITIKVKLSLFMIGIIYWLCSIWNEDDV